ncbi:MAG: Rieske 2Fe-2S domain-containing protein [Thermoplasmatales archaeon]
MLTKEENDFLTRVGPGTPAGELFRKYWHPIVPTKVMLERDRLKVRILGEDLVLFKMSEGQYGLVDEHCAHRGVSLAYGFCENDGIRCPYHGWKYSPSGQCIEQPFEQDNSNYKNYIKISGYKVKEQFGIIWAYLGSEPAPLLPNWEFLVRKDGLRFFVIYHSNYNWLQAMENSMDTTHTYFLHGVMLRKTMPENWQNTYNDILNYYNRPIEKYEFNTFKYGFKRRRTYGGNTRNSEGGYPLIFPNISVIPMYTYEVVWRVPIDDTHTLAFHMEFLPSPDGREYDQSPDKTPVLIDPPVLKNGNGEYLMNSFPSTDLMAFETQGAIFDRSKEHLGSSDRGVAMYRKMLKEEILKVQSGLDPIAFITNENENLFITVTDQGDYIIKSKNARERGLLDSWFRAILNGKMPMLDEHQEIFGQQI